MTEQGLATLVNIGTAGAVIAVVLIFLKFIRERDVDWREFFSNIRKSDEDANTKLADVLEKLVTRVESLEGRFNEHNAAEMEILRSLTQGKAQPRKGQP